MSGRFPALEMLCQVPAGTKIPSPTPMGHPSSSSSLAAPMRTIPLPDSTRIYWSVSVVHLYSDRPSCGKLHQRHLKPAARPKSRAEISIGLCGTRDICHKGPWPVIGESQIPGAATLRSVFVHKNPLSFCGFSMLCGTVSSGNPFLSLPQNLLPADQTGFRLAPFSPCPIPIS